MGIDTFLKIGITLAFLSLSGKKPVANIWFVVSVNDFITAGLTNFCIREEIPSNSQLVFGRILSIVLEIVAFVGYLPIINAPAHERDTLQDSPPSLHADLTGSKSWSVHCSKFR